MRPLSILSAVFLTAATPVFAQVTVDLHALQALPDLPAASHAQRAAPQPAPQVAPQAPPGTRAIVRRVGPLAVPATPAATAPTTQPAMPENVPDTATIAPIMPPAAPAGLQPPSPPPASGKAVAAGAPTTSALRLAFAPGESDLSPDSLASIKQLTQDAPPGDATTFSILAYAPGKPDDPSTARRISLSRAMAVRSALVAEGVPSARIFVRALGEQHGDGPPDRVDVSVTGVPASTVTPR